MNFTKPPEQNLKVFFLFNAYIHVHTYSYNRWASLQARAGYCGSYAGSPLHNIFLIFATGRPQEDLKTLTPRYLLIASNSITSENKISVYFISLQAPMTSVFTANRRAIRLWQGFSSLSKDWMGQFKKNLPLLDHLPFVPGAPIDGYWFSDMGTSV